MTAAFHTLGCKVNQYDTQAMLELFRAAGYEIVPFDTDADVYVVNTCTVTGTGDKKSLQTARRLRREHPDSAIVLCGCLAQRKGEELLETGADLILGTQDRVRVVALLEQALREKRPICAVGPLDAAGYEPLRVHDQEEHTRAVMKIQEGCDNRCTYCIIPSVRGPIRSRGLEDIRAEAAELAERGYTELVLTGIHLCSYGRDRRDGTSLIDAVRAAASVPAVRRIRLGSLEPVIATADFARALKETGKVCPQFHLALQSGSDTVLRRMQRRYNLDMYRRGAANLREAFPDCAITTDVLTGFPCETEEEYRETCDFLKEIGFARIHVFPYSQREGTKAAAMPGQLSRPEKARRTRGLIRIGAEMSKAYRQGWLGREAGVLLEERDGSGWLGYTPEYIQVRVPDCPACRQGALLPVRLTGLTEDGMTGSIVQPEST